MRAPPLFPQRRTEIGGAPVLPDNGVAERPPSRSLPEQRCLALIGDADRGDRLSSGFAQHLSAYLEHRAPNLFRIMLDEAWRREILRERYLRGGAWTPFVVEGNRAGARRALVDGENELATAHGRTGLFVCSTIQRQ